MLSPEQARLKSAIQNRGELPKKDENFLRKHELMREYHRLMASVVNSYTGPRELYDRLQDANNTQHQAVMAYLRAEVLTYEKHPKGTGDRIKELEKALKFYADEGTYPHVDAYDPFPSYGDFHGTPICDDMGVKARAALSEGEAQS